MNRLYFIYVSIFFLLISCNSKKETGTTDTDTDIDLTKEKNIKIPTFKDSLTTSYVKEYSAFVDEYMLAVEKNDKKKIKELQEQSIELVEKAKLVSGKIETKAELSRYQEWMTDQQNRINTLNNK